MSTPDYTKYVFGAAAKSNVDKRKVGCIIVDDETGKIVADGYNITTDGADMHAEEMACEVFTSQAMDFSRDYTVYVSHQPCPNCAKTLAEHGFTKIEVVEAFMKFDGDRLRYDLLDPAFAVPLLTSEPSWNAWQGVSNLRLIAYGYQANPNTMREEVLSQFIAWFKDVYLAEKALVEVLTFGARKYKPNNWRQCEDLGRYIAAMHRHLEAYRSGEDLDQESGFHHMHHAFTNFMFLEVLKYDNQD